jgi:transcriptional regulator with XRE-family HTH domain
MDQQQKLDISARLRELRNNSAESNRSISDHVGVGERSVANWMSGDTGIKYEHAKVVADLFDVDVTWLWTGEERQPQGPTPDPFPSRAATGQADVELMLRELVAGQLELTTKLDRVERLLKDQSRQSQPASRTHKGGS